MLASLAMGVTVLIPWLVGSVVNAIDDGDRVGDPAAGADDRRRRARSGSALTASRRVVAGKVSLAVEYDLRERIYAHLQSLELGYFDSQQTGQLMSRATVDLQSIRFFLGYGLIFITQSALTLVLAGAVMFCLQPGLAFLALLPVPFVVFTASRYNRTSRPALQEVQQRIAELTVEAEESVSGVRVVKAFAREEHMLDRFRNRVNRVFDQNVYSTRLRAFYNPMIAFLPNLGLAVVLLVGGRQVINGTLSLGDFTAFYTYLIMLIGPMRMLGTALGMSQRAIASGNRLFEVLDREPGDHERARTRPTCRRATATSCSRDVVARATATAEPALDGVDLEVEGGKVVALVGPSGSGKTSLVALLARLYDPTGGSVVDRRRRPARRRRRLAAPPDRLRRRRQLPVQRHRRREHRLREARRDPRGDRARRRARAGRIVHRAAAGRLRDDGRRARPDALGRPATADRDRAGAARRPADPDPRRRDLVGRRADRGRDQARPRPRRSSGRTTFIVAHRLSTISLADEIVVLDEGRVVDQGTHEELLDRCPLYREIADYGLVDRTLPAVRPRGARGGGAAVRLGANGARRTRTEATRSARTRRASRRPGRRSATPGCWSRASGGRSAARTGAAARCAGCSACCGPTGCGSR